MTVPACTYYGEYSLTGNYKLYIHLQLDEKFPPIPIDADYYWGDNQTQFTAIGYSFTDNQTAFTFH